MDIWSVGCTFAELLTGRKIFEAESKKAVVVRIFELCGTPSKAEWPELYNLKGLAEFCAENNYEDKFEVTLCKEIPKKALDLLKQ